MIDGTVELLSRLVAIDSVNPSLVAGGAGEREIAAFLAGWARDSGLEVTMLEATPGRPSVVVRARGSGTGRDLLLCGHLDTVTVEGMRDPHAARIDGDRLYGRGAFDMKCGVVAALLACREAASRHLAGDVLVAAVADEEHASLGIQEVLETVWADAAIVTEPTDLELIVAHKGFIWSEVEVRGRAAHGSRPHLGVDAIAKAGPILTAVAELDRTLEARVDPVLGRGSVHASTIRGGEELSSYPALCTIGIERRTLPGETADVIASELGALLEACRAQDPDLQASQRTVLVREPFQVAPDAPIVELTREVAAGLLGAPPAIGGAPFWADTAFIAAAGIPTVMFGPTGEGAHAAQEWVSISSTEAVARVLAAVAERFCV
ncbi:MAG TPA: M20/M25/M40 family metallo-hydrolase [Solirubrobacteraceae bacterium]|jgi:acetylornithine deacetylase